MALVEVLPSLAELTDQVEVGLLVVPLDTGSKAGTPFWGGGKGHGTLGRSRQSLNPTGTERPDWWLATEAIVPPGGLLEIL